MTPDGNTPDTIKSSRNFRNQNHNRKVFSDVDLSSADFSSSSFERARFLKANLTGANFNGANFRRANFTDCDLTGSSFVGTSLGRSSFTRSICLGCKFKNNNYISFGRLIRSNFSLSTFENVDLTLCLPWGPMDPKMKFDLSLLRTHSKHYLHIT